MRTAITKRVVLRVLVLATLFSGAPRGFAIPAFARKYGLPCSACHEAWPMLNNFGQTFKDNGYQLGNDRDAPIYQEPSYWPIMFRVTPIWHRESNNRQPIDTTAGNPASGLVESAVTISGFDLGGVDAVTAGTLYKNLSFYVEPFIGNNGISLSQGWARIDNIAGSRWLNFKLGKFELDQPISVSTELNLTNLYYNYFFTPQGDNNFFSGIGFPQLGVELLGHSENDHTRYSLAVVNNSNGLTGLPASQAYDVYANFNQSFEVPRLGNQQVGVYGFVGQSPTLFQTSGGFPLPGTGMGNRSFYRVGAYGHWYFDKVDFYTFFMHGYDNVFLGNSVPANQPASLPAGAVGPTWNGGFVEAHYNPTPRWIALARYEVNRVSRQANPTIRSNAGDADIWTLGYRWYPIMSPRAGFAWVQEYSRTNNPGAAPITGRDDARDSVLMGFDFDF